MNIDKMIKDMDSALQALRDSETMDDIEDARDDLDYLWDVYIKEEITGLQETANDFENELECVKGDLEAEQEHADELLSLNRDRFRHAGQRKSLDMRFKGDV